MKASKSNMIGELLSEVSGILKSENDLNQKREILEQKMEELMTWQQEQSEFEEFFDSFNDMMAGMHNLDFSQRLPESENKKSFLNFISHGLNMVNEELHRKTIPLIALDKFREGVLKNHLCFVTDENYNILHPERDEDNRNEAFSQIKNVRELISNYKYFRRAMLDRDDKVLIQVRLHSSEDYSQLRTYPIGDKILFIISLFPQNRLEEQLPYMVEIMRIMKLQMDNSTESPSTIIDRILFEKASEIYEELRLEERLIR